MQARWTVDMTAERDTGVERAQAMTMSVVVVVVVVAVLCVRTAVLVKY